MLSIKLIKAGAEDYYLDLAGEDYYLKGGEPPGQWMGGGCGSLNLSGTVDKAQFRRLFRGFHPTKDSGPDESSRPLALVQNAGKTNRQAAWDLTFCMPKGLSVIWSQALLEMRKRLQEIQAEAVEETLAFIEENFAFSRTGKAGAGESVPVKLVAAAFEHGTSRASDPLVHTHLVLMNVGVDASQQTRSILSRPFYQHKMLAGAVYRAKVAHKVHREFGFRAERKGNVYDIKGVPESVKDMHSTRRKEVLQRLREKGEFGAVAANRAATATKKAKQHVARSELFEVWQAANEEAGFTTAHVEALVRPSKTNYEKLASKVIGVAVDSITRNLNHFTAHQFLREVLYAAPEFGVPPEMLFDPVREYLENADEIIPILNATGETRYTTNTILSQEHAMLSALKSLMGRPGAKVDNETLQAVLKMNQHLNSQQREAVSHITQNDAAVRIVQGYAGTGKTTMLKAAVEAWQASGYKVVGACFTGAAAQQLQSEIGIPCDTINMTLADFDTKPLDKLVRFGKHTLKQYVRALQGKKTYRPTKPKRVALDRKSIVLLDEAGMINTRHMKMLMEWAKENNATLVLTGDAAQLAAVQGGSPFLSLSNRIGYSKMTDIKRQIDYWAREASYYLATGQVAKAMAYYEDRGLVKFGDEKDELLRRLVIDWADHAFDRPADARILTLTNDDAHDANTLAQQQLIDRGILDPGKSRRIVDRDEETGRSYTSDVHVGDRVLFTENNRNHNVWNGNTGTVLGFTIIKKPRPKQAIRVRLDDGRVVNVPLSFRRIRLGYASTVHKAQGGTYPEVFVLLGGAMQNLPISYVQGTRSREATHFYTTRDLYKEIQEFEESQLALQMEREVDLSLAADLMVRPAAVATTLDELKEALLSDWKKQTALAPESSLIIVADDDQARDLNEQCQQLRLAMAQVDWERRQREAARTSATAVPSLTVGGATYLVGDRVRFTQPNLRLTLLPNELATVTAIIPEANEIEVELDRGDVRRIPLDGQIGLEHGYAVTQLQAQKAAYQPKHAYLLEPRSFQASVSTNAQNNYLQGSPVSTPPQTIFDSGGYRLPGTDYTFKSGTTQTYSTASVQTQMAVDWQQKMYSLNQSFTSQHPQPGYGHSQTQYSYHQEL